MRIIDRIYIGGQFVPPQGEEQAPLFNPATEEQIGTVHLGNAGDVDRAVAAAKNALPVFARTSKAERMAMLERLNAAVSARGDDLAAVMREEYGAPAAFVDYSSKRAGSVFLDMARTLEGYAFRRRIGTADVEMLPSGVVAAITPWNSNYGFICAKLATAVAAGAPIVIKPSEMSALQTQIIAECLHEAGLPPGVLNIVNGYGDVVGAALSTHRDVAKITFTGSTATGRAILRAAAATLKRVTLELGGKSPNIILDDADLDRVIPQVLAMGFINSGQACIAGTRILAPQSRLEEIEARLVAALAAFKAGDGADPAVRIGPMVSRRQWERVQSYIRLGQQEGARLLAGGEGRPEGLERGWFVRPTIFADVRNDMRIAREEIFGPVLGLIGYRDEAHAIEIANDTDYGLSAYVFATDIGRAKAVAERIEAGRVVINAAPHEPQAPFGGFKQSGIGREFGVFGLEAFLESRAVLA
ncbi:aldehyde dehydrogenase family protein [Ancylobacter defluvii]|uniref:aldehyde dehydrogenase (NAD(+)) n=1 Tax=Ancylobacter defluvii TaxID=1282440 RepID=A0A9W6NAB1_9HYPH|nr:aldehyde dehydrogenase family protein [Ancylobacter defluvii]MBS7587159.1 aldehyde dehydrogenase family protein [Ancylobacter defluvii]GLK83473.1 aldehyde dehydrogenase [Ancylobacter defluvii]